jgi:sec-independent protein translocase protein TatA
MFRQLGPLEITLIVLVIVLFFGAKRLPDAARGLGRSMRIFKSEIKAAQEDDAPPKPITATADDVVEPRPAPTTESTER